MKISFFIPPPKFYCLSTNLLHHKYFSILSYGIQGKNNPNFSFKKKSLIKRNTKEFL